MINSGRMVAITFVALGVGFVGGAWFIGSGVAFQLVPVPNVGPAGANASLPPRRVTRSTPLVKAVAVPRPVDFSGGSGGLGLRADRTDLTPAPGCYWVIEPRQFRLGNEWHSTDPERALGGYPAIDPTSGGLRYLLVQSTRQGGAALELRPVFFDEAANRQVPRVVGGGSSSGPGGVFVMKEFGLDPVQQFEPAKVAYFGIERVTPDTARLLVEGAQREAKEKGMAILPPLHFGAPYPFDLPTADGKRLRSDDLRGKAVLVAICGPGGFSAIGLMNVKKVREANSKDDLAIVNISFDGSAQDARETFSKSGSDGPLVVVPNDPTSRRIWSDGAQIAALPMILLIDREGVLRFTGQPFNPFDLQDRVDTLFGRAKRPRFPKATHIVRPAVKGATRGTTTPEGSPGGSPAPGP